MRDSSSIAGKHVLSVSFSVSHSFFVGVTERRSATLSVGAPWGYPNIMELSLPHGLYYSSSESSIDSGLDSPNGFPDRECANGSVSSSRGSPLNLSEAIAANSLSSMLVSELLVCILNQCAPLLCQQSHLNLGQNSSEMSYGPLDPVDAIGVTPVSPTLPPASDQLFPLLPPNSLAMALQQQPSTVSFRSSFPSTVFSQTSLSPATTQPCHSQMPHALYEGHRSRVLYENSQYQSSQHHHLLNNGKHHVFVCNTWCYCLELVTLLVGGGGRLWAGAELPVAYHMYHPFLPTSVSLWLLATALTIVLSAHARLP